MNDWDQSIFDATLQEYLKVCTRTVAEAINTKAYFVARAALWYTHKADAQDIGDTLGRFVSTLNLGRKNKAGRFTTTRTLELASAREYDAPLAAIIINARRGEKGEPGLYGAAMARAVRALIASRVRSIAFLKSGWLPAIRILSLYAKDKSGGAPTDSQARIFGQEKGSAVPAVDGGEMIAQIINSALAKGDRGAQALAKWGGAGLETAFYNEVQSMREYIERKLAEPTAAANARLN